FALQPFGHSVLQAVFDGLERRERRRIVAGRALEHLLAGGAEDDAPAERVSIEQESDKPAGALAFRPPSAGHLLRGTDRDLVENGRRHELVDDAQAECFGGALQLARENHVQRGARADQTRQSLTAAGGGQYAKLNFRQSDLGSGMIARHPVMTRERELEAAAQTP